MPDDLPIGVTEPDSSDMIFAVVFQHYKDEIYRYCVTRLGKSTGEEMAQEVFVTAWKNRSRLQREDRIRGWLYGIAKNKCKQSLRNRNRRKQIAQEFAKDIQQNIHIQMEESNEMLTLVLDNFIKLKENERILITLRYIQGLTISDISSTTGKSEASVRKQLFRALKHLREMVKNATEE